MQRVGRMADGRWLVAIGEDEAQAIQAALVTLDDLLTVYEPHKSAEGLQALEVEDDEENPGDAGLGPDVEEETAPVRRHARTGAKDRKMEVKPTLMAVMADAPGEGLPIAEVYARFCRAMGIEGDSKVKRRIGIALAQYSEDFERVAKGVYRLRREESKADRMAAIKAAHERVKARDES